MQEHNQFVSTEPQEQILTSIQHSSSDNLLKSERKLRKIVGGDRLIQYRQINDHQQKEDTIQKQVNNHFLPSLQLPKRHTSSHQNLHLPRRKYQPFSPQSSQRDSSQSRISEEKLKLASKVLEQREANKTKVLLSRLNLIKDDIITHPLKYKIASQTCGTDPQKIYQLKQSELSKIKEEYQRKRGIEYLKYSKRHIKPELQRSNTESVSLKQIAPVSKSKNYVREIFKDVAMLENKRALRKKQRQRIRTQHEVKVAKYQQKQWVMGQIVYGRVRKHLHSQKHSEDFNRRITTQQAVDDALINFLKVKIKKVQTLLTQH